MSNSPRILVLGSHGLLGRVVFNYLSENKKLSIYGTTRAKKINNDKLFFFEVENFQKNLDNILKKTQQLDSIINCIGILPRYKSIESLIKVNALFPHELANYGLKHRINIIHVSTDAVFPKNSGKVNENDSTNPDGFYGTSKFLGEIYDNNCLTIRTSIIGFSPYNKSGILESIKSRKKSINGFTNQIWSGCTNLQFAQLCEKFILNKNFKAFRRVSPIYHFSPLTPTTKYTLIKIAMKLLGKNAILKKSKDIQINRILTTNYFDKLELGSYTNDVSLALSELLEFEKKITA